MSTERRELGDRLSSLSADELESLLKTLGSPDGSLEVGNPDKGKDPNGSGPVVGVFPATYAQILFWRLYDADRVGSNNHQSMDFRIHGELDVEALKSSFQILSDSQSSLRTVYFEDDHDVWQRIEASLPIPLEFVDSNAAPDTEEFLKRPFKLESEPPIRVRLSKEGDDLHLLQIVMHHIASDGRSKVVMLQEWSEYYNALKAGQTPVAKIHATSLARKALEEREWLSGNGSAYANRHWEESPFGEGLQHPWPTGRHRVSDLNPDAEASGRLKFDLGVDLSGKVRAFAAERGMTPLQLMMGCYLLCLQRLVPGSGVTVAMPVDLRGSEEEASLVGCLMNVVPVTMDAETPNSVDAYLSLAAERMRKAIEHARMPLYRILEIGHESDRTARTLSWKTLVNFKEDYVDSLSLNGLTVEDLPFRQLGSGVDIGLIFHSTNGESGRSTIRLTAVIDVSKISMSDAAALLETWRSVITQCVHGRVRSIDEIDILLPGERERLHELSGRDRVVAYPKTTLHKIFRKTAERYPDRPAVIEADGRETTYAELQEQVSRVAAFLRSKGIGKNAIVALHLQRSPLLLASTLGVLEAGGAFLLLEPSLPLERLRVMAEQAQVAALISKQDMDILTGFEERTYLVDEVFSHVASCGTDKDESNPASLAYVLFTSGSTGTPKGVMIEHSNIVGYLESICQSYSFGPNHRTLMRTPVSFDACLIELLLPLCTGGGMVLAEPGTENDMQAMTDLIESRGVSHLFCVPTLLRYLMEVDELVKIKGVLKAIVSGGESFHEILMRDCKDALEVEVFQDYGPTEATIAVTFWRYEPHHGHASPPIGKPNAGVTVLVMDELGRQLPPGIPGELWIGGIQTGRGYINNDEETRKLFVDDPIEPGSGRMFYRTGDMARFLPDGNLLFLGRMDDQLKVRGVRIELGDVTAALNKCEGVKDAVVLPEPDGDGSNRLRAWVTLKDVLGVDEPSIRSSLSELLPGYMIPFRIHVVDSIPLTPHGKTDHRALRAMVETDGADAEAGLPLKTETQHILAGLWSELLGVEVGSRDADFFRLGGHSLVAMRLAGRIQKVFGSTLSLPDFYQDGRLDRLATRIDAKVGEGDTFKRLSDMPALALGERVPMSWAQRRMWMLQQLLSNPSSYHIAHVFPIPRERSASEVKSILESMADRHGILRTLLHQEDDGFWQEELPLSRWSLDWMELETDTQEEWTSLVLYEREQPFDLSKAPGWRARWILETGGEPMLLLVFHHALMDEWSMNLFKREFDSLLSGSVSSSESKRPSHSYIDFSRWQHWTFSKGVQERLEAYWSERLSNLGEPLRIMPDLHPGEVRSSRSGVVTRPVEGSIQSMLDAYCRSEGLSRFSVWMSVWQIVQARLGTGEEVILATPVSERDRSEWLDVMGMCLNTLPIRTKVDESSSFRSFSRKNHLSLTADLACGQLAYEDIIRLADGDLGMDGQGLPQVMFVWHGEYEWREEDDMSGHISRKGRHSKNPITIHLSDRGDMSRLTLEYDADLFQDQTAGSILQRFESVARQVLANPGLRIEEIDILLPEERKRLLELSGRSNVVEYPQTALHEIFRKTAERYPDRPAVIEPDGRETTYAELRGQVDKVAGFLSAKGIEREAVVAVHLRRSHALLATMLGISEAGGAFFLMEPTLPLDRLRAMAEQARVAAVITEEDMPVIPGFSERTHRFLDIQSNDLGKDDLRYVPTEHTSLACVIFTSGSTGAPKGAMLEQVNLYNYLYFLLDAYAFGPEVRSLQKTLLSFDVCLYELLLPMFTGGCVVMAAPGSETDPALVVDMAIRHRVTYLFFAPAQLNLFLQVPGLEKANDKIKVILSAGEALEEGLMKRCLSTLEARLSNAYGPAEAGAVTQWICHRGHSYPKPSIGSPNCNVDIWIMDSHGRPVPPGMAGELWIGGSQTGRGYINNEEETRKRFVDDPIEPGSGRRYYRTGDLARFLPDGNILFLGRMDDQLKVRGVRIELGDVTAALHRCDGVKDAVVLPEPDGEGSNHLRGWVTLKDGFKGNESDLRTAMSELLPNYMVPFRIHVIDAIPLTPHGKTDHRTLRALVQMDVADAEAGLPLETETQLRLAEIWTEILHVKVKSREADFFRLGGHSLIAIRLSGRIQKSFGVNFSLSDFYNDGRLDRLAARIDAEHHKGSDEPSLSDMPALLPGERVPMSWAQRRMWILQHLLADPSSYHITHLFPIPADRTATDVKGILESMAERHGILRTRLFQKEDGFWQEELTVDEWRLDWAEMDVGSQEECIALMSQECNRIFDLTTSPGWRARWVRQRTAQDLLLLVFHHALIDEWSMNLFKKEFDALLTGKASPSSLDTPTHSYIDFSRWQHWAFSHGLHERLEAYWRERLSDIGEPVRLTYDLIAPDGASGRRSAISRSIDTSTRHLMDAYCKREGLSRFAVWMAVWQILQARLGSGEEVVIATPVSERDRPEWQELIGMCLNTLPVRAKVVEQDSFLSFSRANHRSLAGDLAHGQLPYEDIVRLSDSDLGMEGHGLPQVMFTLHGEYEWTEEDEASSEHRPKAVNAQNPLSIHFTDRTDTCRATLVYDAHLFLEQTAEKILLRYEAVARQVLENPDIRIADIDILLPGEWERILELSGRDNTTDYAETTLHETFRLTAQRYPDRPAVIEANGRETSYAELQQQVFQVAAFLRTQGIEKESVIAVHMKPSPSLLASMLGVLEAGGAFLLLEPSLPLNRLRTMAEEARAVMILSGEGVETLPGFGGMTYLFQDAMALDAASDSTEKVDCDSHSLAYVMFTSGTTGVPKGVMVEHRNMLSYLNSCCSAYGFGPFDRTLHKPTLSFDLCFFELLLPMMTGGAVVMTGQGSEHDLLQVADLTSRHRVTHLAFTPAMVEHFLKISDVSTMNESLKAVVCGGEAFHDGLMGRCSRALGSRVFQDYGPVETTVAVTSWEYLRDHAFVKPPIGRPNPDVDVLIMSSKGRPVPPGMPGELWIGGAQTGRGYINNEEETRKRFVDDPLEPGSGRRYYRTGDVARFLPDGNLLFIGRMDDQLKVRGVRIEPGDVTAALLRCEGVREAVVLPEPDGEGSNRLRAWVTVKDGAAVGEPAIRSSMTELLPPYMVPFRIHVINSIPLTAHGKTDHRALRAIAEQEGDGAEGLPLTTDTEHRLAAIWSELLGIEVLHRDADFFRLGGHSLIAMRLAGMINKDFKILLPLPELYTDARLERLAAWIDRRHNERDTDNASETDNYKTYPIWEGSENRNVYSFFMGYQIIAKMAEIGRWEWSVLNLIDPQVQMGRMPDLPVESIAPVYADAILARHREGPIVLMGNCINGIDAYATACHLQHRTSHPIHVMLFDTRCPQTSRPSPDNGMNGRRIGGRLFERVVGTFEDVVQRLSQKALQGSAAAQKTLRLLAGEALSLRLFDPEWYLSSHPDLAQAGVDPISHYFALGWKENREPSLTFNASLYWSICPVFQPGRQNPVLHYLMAGRFDASVRRAVREIHISQGDSDRIMSSGWFDPSWYAREYPTVEYHGRAPLDHYMAIGWRFARNPFPEFDPIDFRRRFPSFDPEKENPIRHLLRMVRIPQRTVEGPLRQPDVDRAWETGSSVRPPLTDEDRNEKKPVIKRATPTKRYEDILITRSRIRSRYEPAPFGGDLLLFSNQLDFDHDAAMGWRKGIHGNIHAVRMNGDHDSYLIDDLKSNIERINKAMRMILHAESPKG